MYDMHDMYAPTSNGIEDKVFITESFDPTTHFETAITDVLSVYERITVHSHLPFSLPVLPTDRCHHTPCLSTTCLALALSAG